MSKEKCQSAQLDETSKLLSRKGVEETPHRRRVLDILSQARAPLSAQEVFAAAGEDAGSCQPMNKVTLYRILDLYVEKGVLERHHDGDKSWRFCLPSRRGAHCHFYCTRCGRMQCLQPTAMIEEAVNAGEEELGAAIDAVDIRFDGVCADCGGPVQAARLHS